MAMITIMVIMVTKLIYTTNGISNTGKLARKQIDS